MEPDITVDNIEIAQFLHLLIRDSSIRNALDTITAKVVLLLGIFASMRKQCLDPIRETIRTKLNLDHVLLIGDDDPQPRRVGQHTSIEAGR